MLKKLIMQRENFDVDKFSGSEGSTESKPRYAKSKCPYGLEKKCLIFDQGKIML